MNEIGHKAEAAYQVAKLTSDVHQTAAKVLAASGVATGTIELVLHAIYTLAWLDGAKAGVDMVKIDIR